MPLSEHEQRALAALEQGIHEQDPGFARRAALTNALLTARRRRTLAVMGFAVGLLLIVAFCLTTVVVVGVGGFAVMFASLHSFWNDTNQIRRATLDDGLRSEPQPGW